MSILSDNLKLLRKKYGFSQRDLAKKLNISQPGYAKYENDLAEPDTQRLVILSELYNVSIDNLLGKDKQQLEKQKIIENTITVFGYGGKRRDYHLSEENAKLLEQLAEKMSKEKIDGDF